jgi:RNA polymerase sigma factor (sigma-70 family)
MNEAPGASAGEARVEWPPGLRRRLLEVARRRVAAEAAEDVVQEALRIIVERGIERAGTLAPDGQPGLAYCFQVLRNVIGNHYQRERTRRRRLAISPEEGFSAADPAPGPLEALAASEAAEAVVDCLERLALSDAPCAARLRALAEGRAPGELAREERIEEAAFYRRLYRCRLKFRELLLEHGVRA